MTMMSLGRWPRMDSDNNNNNIPGQPMLPQEQTRTMVMK